MVFFVASCFWLIVLFGCAPAARTLNPGKASVATSPQTDRVSTPVAFQETSDVDKLGFLWQRRSQDGFTADYPIGPGDILEISIPAMQELSSRTVRVSGEGTISLPFIGKIQTNGLTEEKLREQIRSRLMKYMHDPRVIIFVKEYRSRQVAVLGAVTRPGLYSLNSGTDTILDIISQAGGFSAAAEPRIHLIPAENVENDTAKEIASTFPSSLLSQDPSPLILKRTEPILIDLRELGYGGYQDYLSLPARPGDVIMVPGGGQALIEGWVERPGAYAVTPGLTLSAAIASSGGPLFPADTTSVRVIRTERDGNKSVFVTDLEKVKAGKEPDMLLQRGDIIEVSSTTAKLISYGLYRLFSSAVHLGIGGTIPIIKR